ncbi:MAG: D-alanyl-D-alanine carboxypeptidase family protein [Faecousia sp.]
MNTKQRRIIPLILILTILVSVASGLFWYDRNVDRSGWVEKDGVRYYQDFHAHPVSGWLELPEGRYCFHDDGTPLLGWQTIDGVTYYFGDSGVMTTGWAEIDGKTCYFGGNGAMVTGWLWLEEGRYYLRDGALLTGWQEIDGGRCYFDENGIAALGFAEIEGDRYYFPDGFLTTGLTEIDGETYSFAQDGKMVTGWQETEEGRRYFAPEGPMATGWLDMEDGRRYFAEDGLMKTGWLQLGEYRYYFPEDGAAAVGPTEIDGETHYFTPKGIEVVLVNGLNPVPDWYEPDLVNLSENHQVASLCYDALKQMLADCNAAGIEYDFNSGYRTLYTQTAILEYRTREHMETYSLDFRAAREKALETVAVPGTSEHQLGLAVDLLGEEAIAWLTEHCWDYGFILRYTEEKEGITGIVDEPWHFRYVGTEVSLDMKDSGLCLEEYLGAEPVDSIKVRELFGEKLYEEVIYGKEEQNQSQ